MKFIRNIAASVLCAAALVGCTDLDETLYDQVGTQNYYNTKSDVIRAVFRPFEHAYWSIQSRHVLNELTADQLITPTRDGWWDDGGKWRRLHYHQWNVEDGGDAQTEWNGCFQGIMQCNYVIEDLAKLDPARFGISQLEFDNLNAQCRALRAWFYLRLLDAFRNIPLAVSFSDVSLNTETQVEPSVIFKFIEDELIDCTKLLTKKSLSVLSPIFRGNGHRQVPLPCWSASILMPRSISALTDIQTVKRWLRLSSEAITGSMPLRTAGMLLSIGTMTHLMK